MRTKIYILAILLISISCSGNTQQKNKKNSVEKEAEKWITAGITANESRNYEEAKEYFSKAIELDSTNAIVYYNRGNAKYELSDYNGAITDYSKAIEINPNYAEAYRIRGIAKEFPEVDDWNEAIADFNKAIEINPNYAEAYLNRGTAKMFGFFPEVGDFNGAIEDYSKAIEINSNYADAYCARGMAKLIYLSDHNGAIEDLNKSIEIDPFNLNTIGNFITLYESLGDDEGVRIMTEKKLNAEKELEKK
jgi:tetratricopeptide (TPR) repeat protein